MRNGNDYNDNMSMYGTMAPMPQAGAPMMSEMMMGAQMPPMMPEMMMGAQMPPMMPEMMAGAQMPPMMAPEMMMGAQMPGMMMPEMTMGMQMPGMMMPEMMGMHMPGMMMPQMVSCMPCMPCMPMMPCMPQQHPVEHQPQPCPGMQEPNYVEYNEQEAPSGHCVNMQDFLEAMGEAMPDLSPEARETMKELMAIDFAIIELNLYLDTHPTDARALVQRNRYVAMREPVVRRLEQFYGPLTQMSRAGYPWAWLKQPWPWNIEF